MANDYAIIEMGGKQYRVEKGDSVVVDRVNAETGAKVSPRAVAFAGGEKTVLEGPELEKVKVDAVVAEHLKGEKIRVFKYRPEEALPQDHGSPLASDAAGDRRHQAGLAQARRLHGRLGRGQGRRGCC